MSLPAQLDYAARPRRRWRIRSRWIVMGALVASALVVWRYGRQIAAQSRLRWTVRQCLHYSRGVDSVAYEANEFFAAKLAADDPAFKLNFPRSYTGYRQFRGSYKAVDAWESMPANVRRQSLISGNFQLPIRRAASVYFVPAMPRAVAAPLFVHERACTGRPSRLVVIELIDGDRGSELDCSVIDPGPLWRKPTLIWEGAPDSLGETIPSVLERAGRQVNEFEPLARIFFGQINPDDSAKFTLRVTVLKAEFRFEGRLMPNDTIEIEGPLLNEVFSKISDANGGNLHR